MKFTNAFKYIFKNLIFKILIYYCVLSVFITLLWTLFGKNSYSDLLFPLENATMISAFFIAEIPNRLKLFIQNGISRKTLFLAECTVMATFSLIAAIIENIITLAFQILNIPYITFYMGVLEISYISINVFFKSLIYGFALCLCVMSTFSLLGKIALKIGITATFITLFIIGFIIGFISFFEIPPIIVNLLSVLNDFITLLKNPYIFLCLSICAFIIINTISFLLIKKYDISKTFKRRIKI